MESLENVQFVLLRGHSTEKTAKSYRTFVCRRSCETLTYDFKEYEFGDLENENCRPSRGKSSSKMDNACTCRLFVGNESDGKIKVTYIPLHTGHNPSDPEEIQHLRISPSIKRLIMTEILRNVDECAIMSNINESIRL